MKYTVVSSCEWTYPDIDSYASGAEFFDGVALCGAFASFQVHISDTYGGVSVSLSGFESEVYRQKAVSVEANPGFETFAEHYPERRAPFFVNDCLCPVTLPALLSPEHGSLGLYFAIPCRAAGTVSGKIILECGGEKAEIPVKVTVSCACLPAESLKIIMGLSRWEMAKRHGVRYESEEFERLETLYLEALRRQHQNRLYLEEPIVSEVGDNKYSFDFTEFNRQVRKALTMGFKAFNIMGVGFRRSWQGAEIEVHGMDCLSWEAYVFLAQYMQALKANAEKNNWDLSKMFALGIADEPNDADSLTYRALCSVIRTLCPEIKLFDATSDVPTYGAIDIWVPRSDEFMKNKKVFDFYRSVGSEVWFYVCLFPRKAGSINRFLDIPLLATRYLYWGAYKYGFTGYLHWTVNDYQGGLDVFNASCPHHYNADSDSILPPGDDKLIYPGDGEPWISMRLENQRESAEEYEMLSAIAEKDKAIAENLCSRGFTAFDSVNYSASEHEKLHRDIISAYEQCCIE